MAREGCYVSITFGTHNKGKPTVENCRLVSAALQIYYCRRRPTFGKSRFVPTAFLIHYCGRKPAVGKSSLIPTLLDPLPQTEVNLSPDQLCNTPP